jgi:ActR/RegA family two-component response regulator
MDRDKAMLVVDDQRHTLDDFIDELGSQLNVTTATSVREAAEQLDYVRFDYGVIDLKLDNTSRFGGLNVYARAQSRLANCCNVRLAPR